VKSDDALPLTITVTDAPDGAEAVIPLRVADAEGNEWRFAVKARVAAALPTATSLEANFPNPFNPSTTIGYRLNTAGDVKLTVHNSLGQVVKRLVDSPQAAGVHTIQWDGRDENGTAVSSGVYFCRMTTGGYANTIRMMLAK